MLSPNDFKDKVLNPTVASFRSEPDSLSKAFALIWSIDAYASHVAFEGVDVYTINEKSRGKIEVNFKNSLQCSPNAHAWKFRIVREASNATKHALRKSKKSDIPNSACVQSAVIDGYAGYFSGVSHWGSQIVLDLDWQYDKLLECWRDGSDREVRPGPLFSWVPILDIIDPCVDLIENGL
ncbi:hypothetical protein [Phaeobacter porticola]|uniref:Uncharacterized protein n=1 Tax=Phaeobacter porticola TaxID=1844006 RepID=A0A1L3I5B9_9RHOB|nr:hypothetical protein [Phaeobacter porticola]APG47309.1 hypothetical protein PhaeoP97_01898 [Phaeobacter porticola]